MVSVYENISQRNQKEQIDATTHGYTVNVIW